MRSVILLSFFIISFFSGLSQDSSFHLKDYKYRTDGFKALELNIGLNGGLLNLNSDVNIDEERRNLSLTPSFINFYHIKSTDSRLHTSSIQFSPLYNLIKEKNTFSTIKERILKGELVYNRNDKFYKKGDHYLEIGNSLGGIIDDNNEENTQFTRENRMYSINDNITLGIGKGRVEAVQDAQMALFILNDLQSQGLITNVDATLTNEFAKLITAIKNRRIFDGRKRRMYELTQIDSFLRNKNIASETNVRHFTVINDNWSLAFNPLRFSGTNLYFRVMPSAGYYNSESNIFDNLSQTSSTSINKFFAIAPHIGVEKFIPVNLKWQRNMGVDLSWQKTWSNRHFNQSSPSNFYEFNSSLRSSQFALNTFYGIGFYPNNRTVLNANLNVSTFYSKFDNSDIKDKLSVFGFLQFNTDYFISYRSRLHANLQLAYQHDDSNSQTFENLEQKLFSTNFTISFSHIIF